MNNLIMNNKNQNVKFDYINNSRLNEPKTGVLFASFINDIINRKSSRLSKSYLNNYKTLIFHVNNFSEEKNVNIYTNSVNEHFLDDFITYLEEKELRQTYIRNILFLVKSMVRKAAIYGFAVDYSYDDVTIDDEDAFSIYFSMNDITRIYYYKGLTKKQERIKNLFVIGCLTGLRYSDYSTLNKDNFNKEYIIKITKKTGKKVKIPLHDYIKEIYLKYDGEVSSELSVQHFNRYIKKICKIIGFNEEVILQYKKGGKLITDKKKKWELISSHYRTSICCY